MVIAREIFGVWFAAKIIASDNKLLQLRSETNLVQGQHTLGLLVQAFVEDRSLTAVVLFGVENVRLQRRWCHPRFSSRIVIQRHTFSAEANFHLN